MNKFFLMTRGRTGSTAVIDELNKSSGVRATQELFIIADFKNTPVDKFAKLYDLLLPFALWVQEDWLWKLVSPFLNGDNIWADRYLSKAEMLATHQGAASFGFKLLSHHFDEKPFLSALLRRRGYRVIYLTRNIARQVLSGMVASQRGFYNTIEKFEDVYRYPIDLDKFEWLVRWEMQSVEKDLARLKTDGFDFIVVSYEEFYTNRQSFYEKIFPFLGLPIEMPPRSDWSILIKDLRYTVENYDAVAERAVAIGMPLDL